MQNISGYITVPILPILNENTVWCLFKTRQSTTMHIIMRHKAHLDTAQCAYTSWILKYKQKIKNIYFYIKNNRFRRWFLICNERKIRNNCIHFHNFHCVRFHQIPSIIPSKTDVLWENVTHLLFNGFCVGKLYEMLRKMKLRSIRIVQYIWKAIQ